MDGMYLITASGFLLIAASRKAAIVLEELALDYHTVYLDLSAGGHKDKGYSIERYLMLRLVL